MGRQLQNAAVDHYVEQGRPQNRQRNCRIYRCIAAQYAGNSRCIAGYPVCRPDPRDHEFQCRSAGCRGFNASCRGQNDPDQQEIPGQAQMGKDRRYGASGGCRTYDHRIPETQSYSDGAFPAHKNFDPQHSSLELLQYVPAGGAAFLQRFDRYSQSGHADPA